MTDVTGGTVLDGVDNDEALIGATVVDSDGEEIGRVQDVQRGYIQVDSPVRASFWISGAMVGSADGDGVALDFAREFLDVFAMDTPGFVPAVPDDNVAERAAAAKAGTMPRIQAHDAMERSAELLDRVLADHSADPIAWGHRLRHATRMFFEAVKQHRDATESHGGALEALAALKPALVRQLERQRREHHELLVKAEELENEVREELAFDRLDADTHRLAAHILRESLRLHIYRATNLLYEAYFQEEGGEEG